MFAVIIPDATNHTIISRVFDREIEALGYVTFQLDAGAERAELYEKYGDNWKLYRTVWSDWSMALHSARVDAMLTR